MLPFMFRNIFKRVPYLEALYKKAEIGRSFDIQDHATRREFINAKLGIIPSMVAGKSIAIVDEAIFTGATLKLVAHLLQATAVRNVYLLVASPECKARCPFNMQPERPHLSEYVRDVDLAAYFDVTGVFFQEQLVYHRTMHDSRHGCTVCFTAS